MFALVFPLFLCLGCVVEVGWGVLSCADAEGGVDGCASEAGDDQGVGSEGVNMLRVCGACGWNRT